MKKIVILGGGTFSHVRNHLSLATPAFGETAKQLANLLVSTRGVNDFDVRLVLTKMADSDSKLVTNDDVSAYVDELIADPEIRCIIFNVALTDYTGEIDDVPAGKYTPRLETSAGEVTMKMTPAEKLIGKIRKHRKDIFVVGFKTTAGATEGVQYAKAIRLLKTNSLNLVLANDTVTRNNFIVAPEETRYCVTHDRQEVLRFLSKMVLSRITNHFTRSTVVEGEAVSWKSDAVPQNLREVVDYCIKYGAYKPVLGKTAGHFAVKVDDNTILTSIRKTNFNHLDEVGLVRVTSKNKDEVIAHGFKPSVGGQSQRIIFGEHPELDCIVHFHCPVKVDASYLIPSHAQWPNECGSHECGQATSRGLHKVDLGDGDSLEVVFLEDHGPNIVFNRKTPSHKIKSFISSNFDLRDKTGGLASVSHA